MGAGDGEGDGLGDGLLTAAVGDERTLVAADGDGEDGAWATDCPVD